MLTLKKNPLFCMLDTETYSTFSINIEKSTETKTAFNEHKKAYEIGFVIFDSVTCQPVRKYQAYILEAVFEAMMYYKRNGKYPKYWPSRLNASEILKDSVFWQDAKSELLKALKAFNVRDIIAHNVNFDVNALYKTNEAYTQPRDKTPFLIHFNKLELSGYFVYGLPLMAAYNAPFKIKSGCLTFKADYLVPLLVDGIQAHDALGDCMNQLALYKLTKGRYANKGTIYHNMLAHHALKHDDNKRLGNSSLD